VLVSVFVFMPTKTNNSVFSCKPLCSWLRTGVAIDACIENLVLHMDFESMCWVQLYNTCVLQGPGNPAVPGFFSSLVCFCQSTRDTSLLSHFFSTQLFAYSDDLPELSNSNQAAGKKTLTVLK